MRDERSTGGARGRYAAALSVLALGLGAALPAAAQDLTLNKSCRNSIGLELSRVVKTGMKGQDTCQNTAFKVSVESDVCNTVSTFPFTIINGGKYDKDQTKANTKLQTSTTTAPKCVAASVGETLENYPSENIANSFENIDGILSSNADFLLGGEDFNGDKVLANCRKAISKARQNVTNAMVKFATSCQKTVDTAATLTDFDGLSRNPVDCLLDTAPTVVNTVNAAETLILAKCGTTPNLIAGYPSGDAVGSCSDLPDCVTESALASGKSLAQAMYPAKNCSESTTPAARTVAVTVANPNGIQLGGVDVRVRYPRFQSGVPENGVEGAVQSAVTVIPLGALPNVNDKDGYADVNVAFSSAFTSGHLFDLNLDTCVPLAESKCSLTTGQDCSIASDCSQRCAQLSEGGTANGANTFCTNDAQCAALATSSCSGSTCTAHCIGSAATPCTMDSDCTSFGGKCLIPSCVCPTCAPKKCIGDNSACTVNSECLMPGEGNLCVPSESCIPQHDVCSISQWQECGGPGDAVCPPGEDCVTQTSLTSCEVTSALDEFANEIDGVTCTVNVTE